MGARECTQSRGGNLGGGRHAGRPSDLEASRRSPALDGLLVRLVAQDDLIRRRRGAPLGGVQERQGQAYQRSQEQHNAEVVADASPDPEPVKAVPSRTQGVQHPAEPNCQAIPRLQKQLAPHHLQGTPALRCCKSQLFGASTLM